MFIDKVKVKIASGRGGNGAKTFRQEKFVAFGGPDGGDGGRGGSVILEATLDMSTLLDFRYQSIFQADDGKRGGKKDMSGKSGEDLIVKVPIGTVVKDIRENLIIGDLVQDGQRLLVAKGGRGGRGNARLKTNRNKAPSYCEPGEPPVERELELELKMIADVGLIGFPNAGKSTLISKVSAAKPKIADYAFTTITPNLGVVSKENGDAYVMADIPGLIEGASDGVGLGYQFLRHVERTRLLIHMVDVWGLMGSNIDQYQQQAYEDPLHNFIQVNYELDKYSKELSTRKQIVVLNKIEGYPESELEILAKRFKDQIGLDVNDTSPIADGALPKSNFVGLFAVSAVTGEGLPELRRYIEKVLALIPKEITVVEVDEDPFAEANDDSSFTVIKEQNADGKFNWMVSCGKLERLMRVTDLEEIDSLTHLFHMTKALGVIDEIKDLGAAPGDMLNIDGVDFEINEAVLNQKVDLYP